MGIEFMLLFALCVALGNLCMRKSIDTGGTSKTYLMLQFCLSFVFMILLNPVRTGNYSLDLFTLTWGTLCGFALAGVMTFLGKALETGPPALSIAILNSSSVVPILVLVFLFGIPFGFHYTYWNGIGSILVVIGILWATKTRKERGSSQSYPKNSKGSAPRWLFFISLCFLFHVCYLVFIQWHSLFINFPHAKGLFFHGSSKPSEWFLPMIYFSTACVQTFLFFKTERRSPNRFEVLYSALGGAAQGLGTFFMLKGVSISTPLEHPLLFPVFSVGAILFCNIWAAWLYKEKVNWAANVLCILGILVSAFR